MSEAIEGARRLIEGRLGELEAEASSLREALGNLGAGGGRPRRQGGDGGGATSPRRARTRRRAPRGQRQKEVLAAARKEPGLTAADLGRAVGISTNQAYALCQRMLKAGELKKKGKGYAVTAKG